MCGQSNRTNYNCYYEYRNRNEEGVDGRLQEANNSEWAHYGQNNMMKRYLKAFIIKSLINQIFADMSLVIINNITAHNRTAHSITKHCLDKKSQWFKILF